MFLVPIYEELGCTGKQKENDVRGLVCKNHRNIYHLHQDSSVCVIETVLENVRLSYLLIINFALLNILKHIFKTSLQPNMSVFHSVMVLNPFVKPATGRYQTNVQSCILKLTGMDKVCRPTSVVTKGNSFCDLVFA